MTDKQYTYLEDKFNKSRVNKYMNTNLYAKAEDIEFRIKYIDKNSPYATDEYQKKVESLNR